MTSLCIGMDGDALRAPLSGVGHYVFNLGRELDALLPEALFIAYCRLRQSGCLHQIGNCAANLTLRFDGYRRLFGSRRAVVPCAQRTGSTYSGLDARCTL